VLLAYYSPPSFIIVFIIAYLGGVAIAFLSKTHESRECATWSGLAFFASMPIMGQKEVFMQITLTIPDKKVDSFLDVLHHISYVEVLPTEVPKKKKKPTKRSAEEFYEDLKEAIHEVNEAIAGRKQLRTLDEFLDECESQTHC
jgi:flagellar hook-basal body complex protein FliE